MSGVFHLDETVNLWYVQQEPRRSLRESLTALRNVKWPVISKRIEINSAYLVSAKPTLNIK